MDHALRCITVFIRLSLPNKSDVQTKEQYEPNASVIIYRLLLMSGPTHIFALYASARLPAQPSGFQVDCPEIQHCLGSCLDVRHGAQITNISSFVFFASFKAQGALALFFVHISYT